MVVRDGILEQARMALHTREHAALLRAVEQVLAGLGEEDAQACFEARKKAADKVKEHGDG